GERARRDLVGERLEEVEVAAVDQRHLDRRAAELLHRLEPAEAAAHRDNAMSRQRGRARSSSAVRSAVGAASRRSSGIGLPLSTEIPYVPAAEIGSAAG